MKKYAGTLILLLTALIWGMAFVAQSTVSESIGSFTFNASRCLLATVFLSIVSAVGRVFKKAPQKERSASVCGNSLIGGTVCGALLFVAANLQQSGIGAYPPEAAAAGRSGFLTATYVVMVALISLFRKKKPSPLVFLAVAGCMCGMYMLCLSGGISKIYTGDILVFLCAIAFSCYIMAVDFFAAANSLTLSRVQFVVCGALSAIAMLIFEKPDINTLFAAWLPVCYAGVFSSGMGYTLQIIGQKYSEPAVASIVMSLESVFAALAGWLLLQERLSPRELIGCALVFASVILTQIPAFFRSKE